jgi:hypothetical protein
MQYIFLKNILETVLANYVCHNCQNKTNEQYIQVTGISSGGVDLHIHCHVCGNHAQLGAEVNTLAVQMLESENGRKYFQEFLSQGGTIGASLVNKPTSQSTENSNTINDADIIRIHNDLQNAKSIEDLMS